MKKIYKIANRFLTVLCEEELAPETLRAPYSYEDEGQKSESDPSPSLPASGTRVKLELTPKEIGDLNYLMSAISTDTTILKKLIGLHGKEIYDIVKKFNHYAFQLRESLRDDYEDEVRVAHLSNRLNK